MAYKPVAGAQMSSPNVIPMADIMLVLLIVFMVITPMLQKGVTVEMAQVSSPRDMRDADKDDAVIVSVTRDDSIYMGNTKITQFVLHFHSYDGGILVGPENKTLDEHRVAIEPRRDEPRQGRARELRRVRPILHQHPRLDNRFLPR